MGERSGGEYPSAPRADLGRCRERGLKARYLAQPRFAINQVIQVQGKVCRHPGDSVPMRNRIQRPAQLGMSSHKIAQLLQALACRLQHLLELLTSLDLGLAQRHLDAAMGVDLAFARGLDRQEDHFAEMVRYTRLRAVRLR